MLGLDVELVAWSMILEIKQRQKPSQIYSWVVMLCISWLEHFLEMPVKVFFVKVFFDNLMNCLNKDAFWALSTNQKDHLEGAAGHLLSE